jgi:hypothetical protein
VTNAAAGRVLRLALAGWGLGHLAMGRTAAGTAWLVAEGIGLALVAITTWLFAATTWYLVPFVAGMAFIATWGVQAVIAFRAAQRLDGATQSGAIRSPAAAAAWLTLPLLVWGTGFWLIAAGGATPGVVVDRFITAWPEITSVGADDGALPDSLTDEPALVAAEAGAAMAALRERCRAGQLADDCDTSSTALLRDVRFEITPLGESRAVALAQLVRYERRESRFLWLFETTELVPVPTADVLRLELARRPAPMGSSRWLIVNARDLAAVPMV